MNLKSIVNSLKWIWQFPQNLLALCIEGILCDAAVRGQKKNNNQIIWCELVSSPISLGEYIFASSYTTEENFKHACGHSRQSLVLGPSYLIVIGLPLLVYKIVYKICSKFDIKWEYNKFYTERWLMS